MRLTLTVLALGFNHDFADKAERFRDFAARPEIAECFRSQPLIEDTAVFSYGRSGVGLLTSRFDRVGRRDAIIFLSDICSYSYALLRSSHLDYPGNVIGRYDSVSALRDSPTIRGSNVPTTGDSLFSVMLR